MLILEFFGEHFPRERCKSTCDNCIAMQGCARETKDCTEQVREAASGPSASCDFRWDFGVHSRGREGRERGCRVLCLAMIPRVVYATRCRFWGQLFLRSSIAQHKKTKTTSHFCRCSFRVIKRLPCIISARVECLFAPPPPPAFPLLVFVLSVVTATARGGLLLSNSTSCFLLWLCSIFSPRLSVCLSVSLSILLLQAAGLLRLSEAMASRDIRHTLVQLVSAWRGDTVKTLDQ